MILLICHLIVYAICESLLRESPILRVLILSISLKEFKRGKSNQRLNLTAEANCRPQCMKMSDKVLAAAIFREGSESSPHKIYTAYGFSPGMGKFLLKRNEVPIVRNL